MRIKRNGDGSADADLDQARHGLVREGVPGAHGDDAAGAPAPMRELHGDGLGLSGRLLGDGRAPADLLVVAARLGRVALRDPPREERLEPAHQARELNDVGVAEDVAQEGLDGGERVRAAEVEQHDAQRFARGVGHGRGD